MAPCNCSVLGSNRINTLSVPSGKLVRNPQLQALGLSCQCRTGKLTKQELLAKFSKYRSMRLSLRCDRQADTLKFIESIKDEMIIQMIAESQSGAVSDVKIHSSIFSRKSWTIWRVFVYRETMM